MKFLLNIMVAFLLSISFVQGVFAADDKCNSPAADSECVRFGVTQKSAPAAAGSSGGLVYEWQDHAPSIYTTYTTYAGRAWRSVHSATVNVAEQKTVMIMFEADHSGGNYAVDSMGQCGSQVRITVNGEIVGTGSLSDSDGTYDANNNEFKCLASRDSGTPNTVQEVVGLPAGQNTITIELFNAAAYTSSPSIYGVRLFAKRLRVIAF